MHISSFDTFISTIADKSTVQLREFGEFKHNYVSYDSILREKGTSALILGTDNLLPKWNFARTFGTKIPSREEWAAYSFLGIAVFKYSWMDQRLILAQVLERSVMICIFLVAQNMHSFKQKFMQSM